MTYGTIVKYIVEQNFTVHVLLSSDCHEMDMQSLWWIDLLYSCMYSVTHVICFFYFIYKLHVIDS